MFQKEKTIAVFTATSSANEEKDAVSGICRKAKELGWNVLIFNGQYNFVTNDTPSLDTNIYQLIDFNMVSGVLITQNLMVKTEVSSTLIKRCKDHNIPVLSVGFKTSECNCFIYKNSDCMEHIVDHLIEKHNCTVLNLVAGMKGNVFSENRIKAFKRSLKKHNLKFEPERLCYGQFWEAPVIEEMHKFFDSGLRIPDAFVCCNDVMAMAVISELNNHGYVVPDDVLVTGYDGVEFEQYSTPRLTTAKCDYQKLGEECVISLIKEITTKKSKKLQTLSPEIIFSSSCGCQNQAREKISGLSLRALSQIGSLRFLTTQMHRLATMTSTANSISDIKPTLFNNGFHNPNCWILLNQGYEDLTNLSKYSTKNPFSETMDCFYTSHHYKLEEHAPIKRTELIPNLDQIIDEGITNLVIMDLFFGDESLGYIVGNYDDTIVPLTNMERFSQGLSQSLSSIKHRLLLEHITVRDVLTGIYNRRGFYSEIKKNISKNSKETKNLIIHSIDMDELKYINDTFGHKEGDLAIKTLSDAIVAAGGENSINARFGGDEFVSAVLTAESAENEIKIFKEKLIENLAAANKKLKKTYKVQASIGSGWTVVSQSIKIDALIAKADEIMYSDKSAKKRSHPRT
ncbi:MAG: GGDEF domain-containing protein [Treponema sp.]|nr:GGDEF domain-containing protein [Treponema sp.]